MKKANIIQEIQYQLWASEKGFREAVEVGNNLFIERYYEAYTMMLRLANNTDIITLEEYNRRFKIAVNLKVYGSEV